MLSFLYKIRRTFKMKETLKNLLKDGNYVELLDSLGPNGTKIFRVFINAFVILVVIGRFLRSKFNVFAEKTKAIISTVGKFFTFCIEKYKKYSHAILAVSVLLIFVCSCVIVHINKVEQKERIDNFYENYELTYVCAGSGEGQYYTWWEIASVFKPDYMGISNYGTDEGNYLNLLYEVNGGKHTLQQGEVVAVPVLQ